LVAKWSFFTLASFNTMTNHTKHPQLRRAFTLVELLVVIAIIAVLMGIAFPLYKSMTEGAKKTAATTCMTQLVLACDNFYEKYQYLPMALNNNAQDNEETTNNRFMPSLVGLRVAIDENPNMLPFFKFQQAKGKGDGVYDGLVRTDNRAELVGPWRNKEKTQRHYRVVLNYDNDNQLLAPNSIGGELLFDRRVIVYHMGKDGKVGGEYNDDNVYSWNKSD
jgi:prepilin-type N-terminal cleavage/methylation domain-containing protein